MCLNKIIIFSLFLSIFIYKLYKVYVYLYISYGSKVQTIQPTRSGAVTVVLANSAVQIVSTLLAPPMEADLPFLASRS